MNTPTNTPTTIAEQTRGAELLRRADNLAVRFRKDAEEAEQLARDLRDHYGCEQGSQGGQATVGQSHAQPSRA